MVADAYMKPGFFTTRVFNPAVTFLVARLGLSMSRAWARTHRRPISFASRRSIPSFGSWPDEYATDGGRRRRDVRPSSGCSGVPEIRSINAVTFATRDMARAVRFYEALGVSIAYGGEAATFTSFRVGTG